MLFNSYVFILLFLPITFAAYFGLNHFKQYTLSKYVLIVASLFFYGYFNPWYLLIIVSSILLNYILGKVIRRLEDKSNGLRKSVFVIGIVANIGLLFYFKYFDFLIININTIFSADFNLLNIVLPLGISFFTFQQLSYLIDTYKKEVPDYHFADYALFVTFFPQLVAGPIVLHGEMLPQFESIENKKINFDNLVCGIQAFSIGLAKKVIVADTFGKIVDYGHLHIVSLNSFEAILTIFAYTLQIYFDFSGYCDMATGIGLMFNIKLPQNFNSPYKATDIVDFWKRWHMTLTRFLTKYIYIPLGGNRKGEVRKYLNIFIVFLVSGIWHGAGYTFIFWGLLHGIANVLTRLLDKPLSKVPKAIKWIGTFLFLNFSWTYFRATSIGNANALFKRVFSGGFCINAELTETLLQPTLISVFSQFLPFVAVIIAFSLIFLFVAVFCKNTNEKVIDCNPKFSNWIFTMILFIYSVLSLSGISTFLYFNF